MSSLYRLDALRAFFDGKHVLLAGYGREGQSTHRLIQMLGWNTHVEVGHDDREIETLLAASDFDWVVKSPGIPMSQILPLVNASRITSQCDLFLRLFADQTVGVTGTKGKSTTTTLIGHVLQHAGTASNVILAGNMGIPFFDIVDRIEPQTIIVAELSCHQLQGITRAPHLSVLLNLYQEHLDHYGSYEEYGMAKMQIFLRQQQGDTGFYCTDSPDLVAMVETQRPSIASRLIPYGRDEVQRAPVSQWTTHLLGLHNRSNIYVARQLTALLGVDDNQFRHALATFQGLPHRLQFVGTFQGITFYNDSISTIPEATVAALKAVPGVETVILGGFDRGVDYTPLTDFLPTCRSLRNIVFVGAAGRRMHVALFEKDRYNILLCDDYREIVAWCYSYTHSGHSCLLSPAAASYDAFKNFEQRGDTFCMWVNQLGTGTI